MNDLANAPIATILVVDDNEMNRSLAREALEDEGYRVVLANGGAAGVKAFAAERPDCVLLDVRMPEVDGFAACEQIRAMPDGAETPILFLTALRDVDTFDRALASSGDDFLTKPVRPTELVVRVHTALELRQARRDLKEHYALLKNQRDDLLRLQLQKERLMAFVVHDLKNPVNSMDLHAQVLLRDKTLSPTAADSAAQIRAEARQLTRMILNLLDVSKGDEGKLSPKRTSVDLSKLVREVVGELSANAAQAKVRIETDLGAERVSADEDLLRRTLANLVENAIKYAPPDSAVTVTTKAIDGGTGVSVRDTGKGIPADMRDRIFDPFVQVEAGERLVVHGSRGLGLTFCKLAVEAHGGHIWIEDAAPGSRFCATLPGPP